MQQADKKELALPATINNQDLSMGCRNKKGMKMWRTLCRLTFYKRKKSQGQAVSRDAGIVTQVLLKRWQIKSTKMVDDGR